VADKSAEIVVLGSGPGGYASAFRAADLGKKVILVERYSNIGGVCLNVGCIPSKALLHAAKVLEDARDAKAMGISFAKPEIDIDALRGYKDKVVKQLTGGLNMLAKQRKVEIVQGVGTLKDKNHLTVEHEGKTQTIAFEQLVIAAGSQPVSLPFIPEDPRVIDSTGALQLQEVEGEMLVLGGGIIGLEMATVYANLGAKVSIVEMMDQIAPGADKDLVMPLAKRMKHLCEDIHLKTSVTKVEAKKDGLWVTFEGEQAPKENPKRFDKLLVAVGRRPNGKLIGAENAGVTVDERGFIPVDQQMRTNVENIYAIGDIIGNPMLAHKATYEGRLAAEVISGMKHSMDAKVIPAVAYTDPELAWVGKTETECKAEGISYDKGVFPWVASGRAIGVNRTEGMTKLIFDDNKRIIGAGVVGINAGELIGELALAIEMGCDVEDIALTIHPHPTLCESVMLAAEMYEGTITDLIAPKKKKK
jgi:dihydrolipoamide dehydrogenase